MASTWMSLTTTYGGPRRGFGSGVARPRRPSGATDRGSWRMAGVSPLKNAVHKTDVYENPSHGTIRRQGQIRSNIRRYHLLERLHVSAPRQHRRPPFSNVQDASSGRFPLTHEVGAPSPRGGGDSSRRQRRGERWRMRDGRQEWCGNARRRGNATVAVARRGGDEVCAWDDSEELCRATLRSEDHTADADGDQCRDRHRRVD